MSGISTSVEIQDRVSGSLNRITAALYNTTGAFGNLDRASDVAFNPSGIQAMTQEMYRYESRIQELEGSLVDANNRLEEMEIQTRQAASAGNGLEGVFKKVAGAVAAIGIGQVVKQQVTEAVDYASNLTEVQNVVDTVFGENSAIDSWAKNTLNAVGLNELSAKKFSGTMGAMLSSSGIAEDKIASMSMTITELAGDMASFYNLDGEEAFNKIRAGISGETEPLKQLGINMSVANLEAYAMSQGIEASYNEMDQASQTMLRYAYLMDTTKNAQGDFARTSDSFSNQTKLLSENWTAFTGKLASYALPILGKIVGKLNNLISRLSAYTPVIVSVGSVIWNTLMNIFGIISSIVTFVIENWSIISPVVYGVIAALAVYAAYLGIVKGIELAGAAASGVMAVAKGIQAVAIWATSKATWAETKAQLGLNGAMYACPIVWIIVLIIALIAIIYAVCSAIAKMTGIANSGFGVITGGVNVVIQFFKNLGLMVANIALGIGLAIGAVASNILTAFGNAIKSVQSFWYNLLSTVLDVVAGICKALNDLPFIEFDYSGITDKASEYAEKAAEKAGEKEEYKDVGAAFSEGMGTFDTFQDGWVSDAFDSGAEWGDGVADKVSSALDGFGDIKTQVDTSEIDSAYTDTGAGSIADSLSSISGDTSDIKDEVDISNENLKYLKDIAEQEAVNRFTTAEIRVDMTNNNNIASGADVDGIINTLSEGLLEAMAVTAEGVHA